MGQHESLSQMIPIFRRDADEITGAVRMSAAEMVGMEQMPGGRVQIMIRTNSGSQFYITPGLPNLHLGQQALEIYRIRLSGGAVEGHPAPFSALDHAPDWLRSGSNPTNRTEPDQPGSDPPGVNQGGAPAANSLKFAPEGPYDEAVLPALRFRSQRQTRKSRRPIAGFAEQGRTP